ncbi:MULTISPECIES: hypothetical protein [Niastella]|uniref:Lipoprotein n=1 Tax=Niastella soli TaxID=2821487 RepID=A0ABS3YQQ4_9BACT|nr:hypothetical protein [Niastella soli]MBO9200208.1 hypothetical protein [Niastella soli]
MIRNLQLYFLLSILAGCTISSKNFPEPDKLKREIINNITIPDQIGDTIIYESYIGVCGNSSEDEMNRLYIPSLDESPYLDLLKTRMNKTILCTRDRKYNLLDKSPKERMALASVWNDLSKDKVTLTLTGDAVNNNSVTIHESYDYSQKAVVIEKLFTYELNNWKCKLLHRFEFAKN